MGGLGTTAQRRFNPRPPALTPQEKALPPDAKLVEARRAAAEAREHRRLANRHKTAQRRARERFDLFKQDLEAMGIHVVLEESTDQPATHPQGGNSDDRSTHRDGA